MALAEPVWMTRGAWQAIGDALVDPAQGALRAAWREARPDGDRVGVWLTPADAEALAAVLDAQPALARELAEPAG